MLSRRVGGWGALVVVVSDCDVVSVGDDDIVAMDSGADVVGVVAIDSVICLLLLVDLFDVLVIVVFAMCLFIVVPGEYLVCLPFGFIADIAMFLYGIVCIRTDMYT